MDVIDELIACCEAWEPEVCVMGNVRAGEAAKALRGLRADLTMAGAFHKAAVAQRNSAWEEIEHLRAELADMDQVLCLYLMQQNDLRAENAEFQQELTKGIHTCGPTCRKTARCAEMADLREELVDTKAALFSAEMRAKSAEKPDCRVCIWFSEDDSAYCGVQSPLVCINGDAYSPADPVRLYDMGVR